MGVICVRLPDDILAIIDRQVASDRVPNPSAYLLEAARRFAEDPEREDEIAAEALAGIEDSEGGRFKTIATPADAEAWHARTMGRLRDRLSVDNAVSSVGSPPAGVRASGG
jgi:Arc/MetJ-type ribon-helix-helix transcriptional regulator